VKKAKTKIKVTVNGNTWIRVASFAGAGSNDKVYALNTEDGSVQFGDGVHGRKPEVGSTVSVSYRHGAGSAGNISKRIIKNESNKFWVITRRSSQAVGWGKRPC